MCELFALSCNKIVNISFSFTKFEARSHTNPHGWGVGFYRQHPEGYPYATIIKEPIPAYESIFKDFLKTKIRSNIFISHVRRASGSVHVPLNTHPFELMLDPRPDTPREKSWIFAHNGTISGIKRNEKFKSPIKTHGNTDSEYAFCYIINQLRIRYRNNNYNLTPQEKIETIKEAADTIDDHYPKSLNFIMSDGHRVYAYYSGHNATGGLWYLERKKPHKELEIHDTEDGMTLKLQKSEDEKATLVATKPLTSEKTWTKLQKRELIVLQNGELIQSLRK